MLLFSELARENIALEIVRKLSSEPLIAIDTETNGQDIRDGRGICYGVSLATPYAALYLPFRHINQPEQNYDLRQFLPLLQEILDKAVVIYHNAKFDLLSLETLGLKARGRKFVDTMVLAHLVDENRPFAGKSLDACTKMYLDDGGKRKSDEYVGLLKILGYAKMPADCTAEYATWDAWLTYQLYQKLLPKLKAENLGDMWNHKAKMIDRLISMEGHGVDIDQPLCEEMADKGRYWMEKIPALLGGLNPGSGNDLQVLLLDILGLPVVKRTPKGKPSFDKYAMEVYDDILERSNDLTAKRVTTYRGWQKSTTSNYEPYVRLLSPDQRLRPDYLLHGTVTGRMSCRHPNLQQIPREGDKPWNGRMKSCFVGRPGYVLIEGDFSQLEFRLSASFSKDPMLTAIFNDEERDIFTEMSVLLGMSRYDTKRLVYCLSYGGGATRISAIFGVSITEGQAIRDNFYRTYPRLKHVARYAQDYALRHKQVPMWSGRSRHFLNPKLDAHKAYNSLTQGGAADVVERTMIRCAEKGLDVPDCRMLLQVHDSIVWEIREDLVPFYTPVIKETMEAVDYEFGVKFKADVHAWSLAA
jgi:DNA polymerase-1